MQDLVNLACQGWAMRRVGPSENYNVVDWVLLKRTNSADFTLQEVFRWISTGFHDTSSSTNVQSYSGLKVRFQIRTVCVSEWSRFEHANCIHKPFSFICSCLSWESHSPQSCRVLIGYQFEVFRVESGSGHVFHFHRLKLEMLFLCVRKSCGL